MIINSGVTIPIAARASEPKPDTPITYARLLIIVKNKDKIIGMLKPRILFLGFVIKRI